jgi:hypothetical protein
MPMASQCNQDIVSVFLSLFPDLKLQQQFFQKSVLGRAHIETQTVAGQG